MDYSDMFAKGHMEKWVNAWNNHDLKTVLSMYSDNVEFSSPKIKVVFPDRKSSKITNKSDLERYWT
jgi:ketosteroid isomerase-like protein